LAGKACWRPDTKKQHLVDFLDAGQRLYLSVAEAQIILLAKVEDCSTEWQAGAPATAH
jgi:hypothetical protein